MISASNGLAFGWSSGRSARYMRCASGLRPASRPGSSTNPNCLPHAPEASNVRTYCAWRLCVARGSLMSRQVVRPRGCVVSGSSMSPRCGWPWPCEVHRVPDPPAAASGSVRRGGEEKPHCPEGLRSTHPCTPCPQIAGATTAASGGCDSSTSDNTRATSRIRLHRDAAPVRPLNQTSDGPSPAGRA